MHHASADLKNQTTETVWGNQTNKYVHPNSKPINHYYPNVLWQKFILNSKNLDMAGIFFSFLKFLVQNLLCILCKQKKNKEIINWLLMKDEQGFKKGKSPRFSDLIQNSIFRMGAKWHALQPSLLRSRAFVLKCGAHHTTSTLCCFCLSLTLYLPRTKV